MERIVKTKEDEGTEMQSATAAEAWLFFVYLFYLFGS